MKGFTRYAHSGAAARFGSFPVMLLLAALLSGSLPAGGQSREEEDPYRRWLTQDVVYLITPEEKDVFAGLSTDEEKQQFVEQFWYRRDPDPRTSANEFKEEHYRRLAYANETFTAGIPGWKTDRGRVYITHGPPDDIERHAGGTYVRPYSEGGGTTSAFPFERWWYRHLPGIGDGIELEFVDDRGGGLYQLALDANRKDALLYTPGAGGTYLETLGVTSKVQRVVGHSIGPESLTGVTPFQRFQDRPMEKILTQARIHQPPPIQNQGLKELVESRITYSNLPFRFRSDFFPITPTDVLIPLTLDIDLADVGLQSSGDTRSSTLDIYARVTSPTGKLIGEFEDTIVQHLGKDEDPGNQRGFYQRKIVLAPGLYKLELIVKDATTGRVGVVRERLEVPGSKADELDLSSVVIAERIEQSENDPEGVDHLVFGDTRLVPSSRRIFGGGDPVGIYFQLRHLPLDQQTGKPLVQVEYSIAAAGLKSVWRDVTAFLRADAGFWSFTRFVDTASLPPGEIEVRVRATDLVTKRVTEKSDRFTLQAPVEAGLEARIH